MHNCLRTVFFPAVRSDLTDDAGTGIPRVDHAVVGAVFKENRCTVFHFPDDSADSPKSGQRCIVVTVSHRYRRAGNHLARDAADRIVICTAEISAGDGQVFDHGSVTQSAEQSADIVRMTVEIPNSIAASVKMSAKTAGRAVRNRLPVRDILHIDVLRHTEVHTGCLHFLEVAVVTQIRKIIRCFDEIRIIRCSFSLPGHPLTYLDGQRNFQNAVHDINRIVAKRKFSRSREFIPTEGLGMPVAVKCGDFHSCGVKNLAGIIAHLVRFLCHRNCRDIGRIRIQSLLAADQCDGGRKRGIVPHITALRLRNRTEQLQCRLQLRLVSRQSRIVCRFNRRTYRPDGIRCFRGRILTHIVQGPHAVFKPPIGHQRVGCLIVCHGIPSTVCSVAKTAVRQ
ncbi:unknown [Clostridium sp. CAG:448]|nr:unknown [Clostridium sp. CAG:448]